MRIKGKLLIFMLIIMLSIPYCISYGYEGEKRVEANLSSRDVVVNGVTTSINCLEYGSESYIDVNNLNQILKTDIQITDTPDMDMYIHGIYAIESYEQYKELYRNKTLSTFDSISYGWATIDRVDNKYGLVLNGSTASDFLVPSGYDEPLDLAGRENVSSQLMVYADKDFKGIFEDKVDIVNQIISTVNGDNTSYSKLVFDGVTIDFEFVGKEEQEEFIVFLRLLKEGLSSSNKKLYVAVPPYEYFSYYRYKNIAHVSDYTILMEHDYDDKYLKPGYIGESLVKTPISPLDRIKGDIENIVDVIDEEDRSKLLLQLSFDTTQWSNVNGQLSTQEGAIGVDKIYPANPSYSMLYDRVKQELDKGLNIDSIIKLDEQSASPYIQYIDPDTNISHVIWYEDSYSIATKMNLVREYSLGGISIWRLGTIPNYNSRIGMSSRLNIWQYIIQQSY